MHSLLFNSKNILWRREKLLWIYQQTMMQKLTRDIHTYSVKWPDNSICLVDQLIHFIHILVKQKMRTYCPNYSIAERKVHSRNEINKKSQTSLSFGKCVPSFTSRQYSNYSLILSIKLRIVCHWLRKCWVGSKIEIETGRFISFRILSSMHSILISSPLSRASGEHLAVKNVD